MILTLTKIRGQGQILNSSLTSWTLESTNFNIKTRSACTHLKTEWYTIMNHLGYFCYELWLKYYSFRWECGTFNQWQWVDISFGITMFGFFVSCKIFVPMHVWYFIRILTSPIVQMFLMMLLLIRYLDVRYWIDCLWLAEGTINIL